MTIDCCPNGQRPAQRSAVESDLTPQQRAMVEVWEKHMSAEFVEHGADGIGERQP
jgi:hypothetical protein